MRKIKKSILLLLIVVLFELSNSHSVFAQVDYVLPYPSFMPGNKLYSVHKVWESIQKYWHFGNFNQFTYNLELADKYLVESKTLFEYKQYLLAYTALQKSNSYFTKAYYFLGKAKQEGKDISQKQKLLHDAGIKHIEALRKTKKELPEEFIWSPEKQTEKKLFLWKQIDNAIHVRESCI